jgi:transcriptional regulator with XRE-family HTH domain
VSDNGATVGEVLVEQLRAIRRRRAWSQADLADELANLGADTLNRTAISKVENGTRRVTVEELLLLAAALNVTPVHLLVPYQPDTPVALTPALTLPAGQLRRWIYGAGPLPGASDQQYFTEVPPDHWSAYRDPRVRELGTIFQAASDAATTATTPETAEDADEIYNHLAADVGRAIQRARRALRALPSAATDR